VKKIIFLLLFLFFLQNNSQAKIIELEKCYAKGIVFDSLDPKIQKKLDKNKWSNEVWSLFNILLYKKFDDQIDGRTEIFKIITQNNLARFGPTIKNHGNYVEVKFIIMTDETIKNDNILIKNLLSQGWKKIDWLQNNGFGYSIDTEKNSVTRYFYNTEDSIEYMNKVLKLNTDEIDYTPIIYKIITFAGGVIQADNVKHARDKLFIDLKNFTVSETKESRGFDYIQICKPPYFKENINQYYNYWWVVVLLAGIVFYIYTQTTGLFFKKKSIDPIKLNIQLSNNFLKDFYQGKIGLGFSYWIVYGIGNFITGIVKFLVSGTPSYTMLWNIVYVAFYVFSLIGTWRSADNYKAVKIKAKTSYLWANVAYVLLVLQTLQTIVFLIK
jgi:hypothetical protein